jgi:hypothetical protein
MLDLMNYLFKQFCIEVYHNDNDCSIYRSFSILFLRSLQKMIRMILSVQKENRLTLIVVNRYEKCHESLLIATNLIDRHLLISS